MKKTMIIPSIVIIGAFIALPVAAEMYKWKDKNGEIHYTQTPPPAGLNGKDIEADIKLSTGKLGNSGAKPSNKTDGKNDLATAEEEGKKSEEKHQDFCTQQENTLKQMTASSLIKWKDEKGERYLTAAEKTAKMNELKQNIDTMCRPEMFSNTKNRATSDTEPSNTDTTSSTRNSGSGIKAGGGSSNNNNSSENNTPENTEQNNATSSDTTTTSNTTTNTTNSTTPTGNSGSSVPSTQ